MIVHRVTSFGAQKQNEQMEDLLAPEQISGIAALHGSCNTMAGIKKICCGIVYLRKKKRFPQFYPVGMVGLLQHSAKDPRRSEWHTTSEKTSILK